MIKERRITKKTVLLISALSFALISLVLTVISLAMSKNFIDPNQSYASDASSIVSLGNDSSDVSDILDISIDENEVSNTFAESGNDVSYEASDTSDKGVEHGWVINEFGYTYIYGDCGFEQFNYKSSAMQRYVNSINGLAEVVHDESRLFNITVPVSSTFVAIPREIYIEDNFYNQSQSAFVSTVGAKLNEHVVNIPVVSMLESEYDNGKYVFFRTDRNWTSLGAYQAYMAFCSSSGLTPFALENFTEIDVGEFLGSFYVATNNDAMQENPDQFICYSTLPSIKTSLTVYDSGMIYSDYNLCDNKTSKTTAYNFYLGRTAGRYEINTTSEGGALLIIGDSSAYALAPYLTSHYSKIDIINPIYFDSTLEEFFADHKYDDVITMCYSTNAVSGDYIPSFNIITGAINEQ